MADASIDALVRDINWRNACAALGVSEELVRRWKSACGDEELVRRHLCAQALHRLVADAVAKWEACDNMGIRLPWPHPHALVMEELEKHRAKHAEEADTYAATIASDGHPGH